jgi:two-component system sensor histidine kinase KdpD
VDDPPERARPSAYAWTALYVALTTAAAWSARTLVALPDLVALYLLVIMLVAVRYGRGPSALAAALSVIAYDWFFIEPLYTFAVHDQRNLLTFAIMFAVGLVISELVRRVRLHERAARAALLRARTEEIRSSLLTTVSHDLRTPLAAIAGAGSTLREHAAELDEAARRELCDTVCQEADRLERLVVNLLDMTRLSAGALPLRREWVPIDEVVGSAVGRVEGRLGARPLRVEVPGELPLVSLDPVLVEHALVNLLENALRHTPPGTEVALTASAAEGGVAIEVADRGPGVPEPSEPLFDKFVRGPGASAQGAGLGLAIARGVARAHGGEVVALNRADGGACFRMTLPLGGLPPRLAEPPQPGARP